MYVLLALFIGVYWCKQNMKKSMNTFEVLSDSRQTGPRNLQRLAYPEKILESRTAMQTWLVGFHCSLGTAAVLNL